MVNQLTTVLTLLLLLVPAHAIDVTDLWQPGDPAASEERMLAALETARGDDALIIRTQIARSYMFRKDFDQARTILREIEPDVDLAGAEAQARFWLELGRSYASHQHPPDSQTDETRALAHEAYETALAITQEAGLDGLTVDVLHMFPFVNPDPAQQLSWTRKALDARRHPRIRPATLGALDTKQSGRSLLRSGAIPAGAGAIPACLGAARA